MRRYFKILVSFLKRHLGVSKILFLQKCYLKARYYLHRIKKEPFIQVNGSETASAITRQNVKNFVQHIHDNGIGIFFLRSITEYNLAFGVCIERRDHLCRVLEECIGVETTLRVNDRKYKNIRNALKISILTEAPLVLYNRYGSDKGRILFSCHNAISLFFFRQNGEKIEAVINNEVIDAFPLSHLSKIDPDNFFRISSWAEIYAFDENQYNVDIVYTWVNGDDPKWQEKKKAYESGSDIPQTASSTSRYRNRDELKYSLRSVFMYADWVRYIYIVTDDQVPAWLAAHEKVKIISHRDIFKHPSALPVFNSHAIESQLHRIDGLAEHFIYLNDDVLIGRPISRSDFFTPFGKATKFFWSSQTLIPLEKDPETAPVDMAANNNACLLMERFKIFPTRKFKHTPIACLKSTVSDLETQFPEIFEKNCHSRFRSQSDYSILSGLIHHYGYLTGRAFPGGLTYSYINLGNPQCKERMAQLRMLPAQRMVQCFCINDVENEKIDADVVSRELISFLEYLYPFPSQVERPAKRQQPDHFSA